MDIQNINAEKVALDQMLVEQIRSNVQLRTEINLLKIKLDESEKRISNLLNSPQTIQDECPEKDITEVPVACV